MIKALLFDLDDTLLGNDMASFLPAYFGAVTRHFPDYPADALLNGLLTGTRALLANVDPLQTLRQVFLRNFPPARQTDEAALWARFEAFYQGDFDALRALTTARPAARAALEWAFAAGYRVVVATSPLFPLSAVRARLRWAGVDHFPFEFITHLENSHFAKPHPEYFAEILARLGLRPDEALMIGNDWSDDLTPAAALGLPHFWITAPETPPPQPGAAHPIGQGQLEGFLLWAQTYLADFQPPPPPPAALPALLIGQLAYGLGALTDLPAGAWSQPLAEDGWTLTEMICHLRDVEREVNLARARAVLTAENPFLNGLDTDQWVAERGYAAQSGPQALTDFAAARQELTQLLAALPAEAWQRPGRHAFFGPTTLAEITGWMLEHDRLHLRRLSAPLN